MDYSVSCSHWVFLDAKVGSTAAGARHGEISKFTPNDSGIRASCLQAWRGEGWMRLGRGGTEFCAPRR